MIPSDTVEGFVASVQAAEPAPEKQQTMAERREGAALAGEDALDKALEDGGYLDDDEDDEGEAPAKGAKAKAAPKDVDEDDEAPELDEDEEEAGDEDAEPTASDEDEEEEPDEEGDEGDLDAAWDFLTERKVAPLSVLKKTAKETLIAWADSIRKREAAASAAGSDGKESTAKAGSPTAGGKGSDDPATLDWKQVSDGLAEELGVDPERAERAFKPLVDVIEKAASKQVGELRELVSRLLTERGRERVTSNMRRLSEAYPTLAASPKLVERVKQKALVLGHGYKAAGEDVPDLDSLFDEAAKSVLGPAKRAQASAAKRRNGVSRSPSEAGSRVQRGAASFDSWFDDAMRDVEDGRSIRSKPPRISARNGSMKF